MPVERASETTEIFGSVEKFRQEKNQLFSNEAIFNTIFKKTQLRLVFSPNWCAFSNFVQERLLVLKIVLENRFEIHAPDWTTMGEKFQNLRIHFKGEWQKIFVSFCWKDFQKVMLTSFFKIGLVLQIF